MPRPWGIPPDVLLRSALLFFRRTGRTSISGALRTCARAAFAIHATARQSRYGPKPSMVALRRYPRPSGFALAAAVFPSVLLGVFAVLLLSFFWFVVAAVFAFVGAPRLCWAVWLWGFVVVLLPAVWRSLWPLCCWLLRWVCFVGAFGGALLFFVSALRSSPVGSSAFLFAVFGLVVLSLVLAAVLPSSWVLRAWLLSFFVSVFGFLPRGARARRRRAASGAPSRRPLAGSGLVRLPRSAVFGG